ncbi:MAG: bifunctional phosphopantothenoylcysteine decarboxylase/phosphopantothenate--cysteine ligase CoaBC [Desulfurococcales archaeon]|nr:bifunctional phosphopantothenoylcysteine decarboxylase/phosphopantothenate--cysteine ligase CoaBC [Desulfurococcales archaeon]
MDYHPVRDIRSIVSSELKGKCILLGVTGSIALYKSVDYARNLIKRGADIHIMMTPEALKMISPSLFEWATGNPVITGLTGKTEHIYMARRCDAMVIVPATLNTISKMAQGITDENVSLTAVSFIGYKKNVLLVPAMHLNMYKTSYLSGSLTKLQDLGYVYSLSPRIVEGSLKIHEVDDIVRWSIPLILRGRDLKGVKMLVTAGSTREYLDKVRFITNPGTGRMGVEIASEAYARGADVVLLTGHLEVRVPKFLDKVVRVETTEEMAYKMEELTSLTRFDVIISAASPVDFKPSEFHDRKLRSGQEITVNLVPTPKVISGIQKRPKVMVAFVADLAGSIDELKEMAFNKLKKHDAELTIANNVGRKDIGFASEYNEILMAYKNGNYEISPKMRKEEVSRFILDRIRKKLFMGE